MKTSALAVLVLAAGLLAGCNSDNNSGNASGAGNAGAGAGGLGANGRAGRGAPGSQEAPDPARRPSGTGCHSGPYLLANHEIPSLVTPR
mgnify:CR=1 FL=1